jgi:hypothetical protein
MESIKAQFFGRRKLLEDIVEGVLAPTQPLDFSLVGPKMIGKSRLLKYLASPDGPLLGPDPGNWRPERFREGHNIIVGLYNCEWPDAQTNLPNFINHQLRLQLESEKNLGLDWSQIESIGSPGQQILQIARQLDRQTIRLVLMLDNFDYVLRCEEFTPDTVNELRPLTSEMGLIVVTEHPLHDLNQTLATSPLFNLMHQHFVGLLEPDVAQEWINTYEQRLSWAPRVGQALLEMAGRHPFLLARINDAVLEIKSLLLAEAPIEAEHLSLIKLRLAEHGRQLFNRIWQKLENTQIKTLLPLVKQLISSPIALSQFPVEQRTALNWLINYAVVAYDDNSYHLFSPLLQEFLAHQMGVKESSLIAWPITAEANAGASTSATDIFETLPPKEAELLHYFQAHSDTIISVERLLTDVWHQPDASPRRVQEAIRRLRNNLNRFSPRIGVIENERGLGYRYIPARPVVFE